MFVTFHTLKELPFSVEQIREEFAKNPSEELRQQYIDEVRQFRREFELPCWPYNDQEHMEHFKEFLRELDVVYYDDGVTEDGDKDVGGPIYPFDSDYYKEMGATDGFIHRVHLYQNTSDEDLLYTPMRWPYNDTQSGVMLKDKISKDPIMSDELAWGEMNTPTKIERIVYGGFIKYKKVKSKNVNSVSNNFDMSRFNKKGKTIKQEQTKEGDWKNVG